MFEFLREFGFPHVSFYHGIIFSVIPVIVLAFLAGFLSSLGNDPFYQTNNWVKEKLKSKSTFFSWLSIGIAFICIMYIIGFDFAWFYVVFAAVFAFVLTVEKEGNSYHDMPVVMHYTPETNFTYVFGGILFSFFLGGLVLQGVKYVSGSYAEDLTNDDKVTFLVQRNISSNLPENVHELHRLKAHINNLPDSADSSAALGIIRSFEGNYKSMLQGLEFFITKDFQQAEKTFRDIQRDTLAQIARLMHSAPKFNINDQFSWFPEDDPKDYYQYDELESRARTTVVEKFNRLIHREAPQLSNYEMIYNAGWSFWYYMMAVSLLFYPVNVAGFRYGASLINKED